MTKQNKNKRYKILEFMFFKNYLSDQKSPKSLENKQDMH